jgi:hypothetical protein
MLVRALAVWLLLLFFAVVNGAFREGVLSPTLGPQAGHVASTILLSAMILLLAWLSIGWIGPRSRRDAVTVGFLWAALVLAFEFLAGRFLFGRSWEYLLADYNVFAGRAWIVVPLLTFAAPLMARRWTAGTQP